MVTLIFDTRIQFNQSLFLSNTHTHLCVTGHIFGPLLLVRGLVAVTGLRPLQLSPPGFSPSGLGANRRGGLRKAGGAQQALPGAQVVLLHRAVLVALMAGTVYFVVTGV